MRDDRLAEWLLRSVTTRERAASAVSDLRESAATRGEAWFWWSILGAAASLLWRGMVAEPRRMLGLALRGLLMSFVAQLFVMTILFAVSAARTLLSTNASGGLGWSGGVPFNGSWTGGWIAECLSLAGEFFVGVWIARRAPGRELSACLAMAALQLTLAAVLRLALAAQWSGSLAEVLWIDLFCFLGALTVRHRART